MKIKWKKYLSICACVFVLYLCITYWKSIENIFVTVLSAASPLIIGCAIAYPVNILMSFYERHWFPNSKRKIAFKTKRGACLIGAYLSMLAIVSLVIWIVVPELISCLGLLAGAVPKYLKELIGFIENSRLIPDDIVDKVMNIDWNSKIEQIISVFTAGVTNVANILIKTLTSVFSAIVTAFISIIFSIYLLSSKDRLKAQGKKLIESYLPEKLSVRLYYVLSVLDDSFRKYLVGQCTEAVILGVLCTVGMLIFRFPYATMVGALTAFTALIPIAGAYIGAGVGAFMIMTVSPVKAVLFLIFIIILQQLEGNIVYPRVVGSSMGLPGIWVLAAITVGGGTFGVIGMFLGVPIAATVYRIVRDNVASIEEKKKAELVTEE